VGEKPILFSGPMVRAIMEGRKDVTRRLINPQPPDKPKRARVEDQWVWYDPGFGGDHYPPEDCRKPRYHKGDVLWVREAWCQVDDMNGDNQVHYRSDGEDIPPPWRPSIHMPKWACRLWLRVTEDPYPERVRDITEAEAIREGVERFTNPNGVQGWKPYRKGRLDVLQFPQNSFQTLWESLHGPDSWERDWVWRIAFERTEAPHG